MAMKFIRPAMMALCAITAGYIQAQTEEVITRTVEDEDDGVVYRFGTVELVKTDEPLRDIIRQARSNDEPTASEPTLDRKSVV